MSWLFDMAFLAHRLLYLDILSSSRSLEGHLYFILSSETYVRTPGPNMKKAVRQKKCVRPLHFLKKSLKKTFILTFEEFIAITQMPAHFFLYFGALFLY